MIKTLYIRNFILIDELLLDFGPGFNVLLGETGAGKSIIIKAIDTVLGAKTSKDVLKNKEKNALIEITFQNNNNELVISREISKTGTKCRINGGLANLESIKEEKDRLVDIHSQFQTYSYIQQKYHIELLDSYISSKNKEYRGLLKKQNDEFKKYAESKKLLEKITAQKDFNRDKIEFLKFQIDEIEKAEIKENEEEALNRELEILSNTQELKETSYSAFWSLGGEEGSIVEALSKIGYNISKIKDHDGEMSDMEENYFNALEILRDVSYSLRNYSESLQDNPERLNEVNERLELIEKLKRKYGNIFESYEKFVSELKMLEKENMSSDELSKEINALEISMNKNCEEIRRLREIFAGELSVSVTNELKKLEFDCPRFFVSVKDIQMNSKGKDYVEFMITTNAAKELAPLVKTVSGGEISRIMLALKTIFANVDKIPTIIFDEIDTGISGKTSVSVANEIFELSNSTQVFAITHQPIIASKADSAYWVSKKQLENNTLISVSKLDSAGKIKALAQMSAGIADEKSISFAREVF